MTVSTGCGGQRSSHSRRILSSSACVASAVHPADVSQHGWRRTTWTSPTPPTLAHSQSRPNGHATLRHTRADTKREFAARPVRRVKASVAIPLNTPPSNIGRTQAERHSKLAMPINCNTSSATEATMIIQFDIWLGKYLLARLADIRRHLFSIRNNTGSERFPPPPAVTARRVEIPLGACLGDQ